MGAGSGRATLARRLKLLFKLIQLLSEVGILAAHPLIFLRHLLVHVDVNLAQLQRHVDLRVLAVERVLRHRREPVLLLVNKLLVLSAFERLLARELETSGWPRSHRCHFLFHYPRIVHDLIQVRAELNAWLSEVTEHDLGLKLVALLELLKHGILVWLHVDCWLAKHLLSFVVHPDVLPSLEPWLDCDRVELLNRYNLLLGPAQVEQHVWSQLELSP